MKFLKADYLGESESKPEITEAVKVMTEKERKLKQEFEKIRRLDTRLA